MNSSISAVSLQNNALTNLALGISVSPRKLGNSDFAAEYFMQFFNQKQKHMDFLALRSFPVKACVSCGRCDQKNNLPCILDRSKPVETLESEKNILAFENRANYLADSEDNANFLFDKLFSVPALLICSPIYFYHVPALFKSLIDRSQYWWNRKLQGHERFATLPPKRLAYLILIAARPQGLRLFEGALVSLKYFLDIFNFELQTPLLLKGLDAKNALKNNPEALANIKQYAEFGAEQFSLETLL
ncbi:flavodoxin family protein [Desulfovibrio litoralis]|uniref:NADPH-dependent FMN reductase n=1 Tax=Desulfovibrio litoralis DSM 11393 TaxID=1121455 RepID=A0A1M7SD47_9BACT|nr:NAD(P)H-dependent oxidoreductase [Desulfovibrio litoralis]SHN56152.1 NADPH-dependent FMN reductase [Desulfovibrio litoralis DSM 11393]